ncbi:MAG: TonB-dependent receptor plug domain-containing protein [Chitinivibrionales bacterium]|nr:TonB-dependent receptor plug domain-containing protein [Chitinivibrionales bacterium]MBD3356524.1 TonB-dependent receptor plug domain-containing protein [Chitinivibrionales bacterium]
MAYPSNCRADHSAPTPADAPRLFFPRGFILCAQLWERSSLWFYLERRSSICEWSMRICMGNRTALIWLAVCFGILPVRGQDTATVENKTEHSTNAADAPPDTPFVDSITFNASGKTKSKFSPSVTATFDSVVIEGIVIDAHSGEYPGANLPKVYVDSRISTPDESGGFGITIPFRVEVVIEVTAKAYAPFRKVVTLKRGKRNYFVTAVLEPGSNESTTPPIASASVDTVTGPPWTIFGAIVDSRLDLALESDGIILTFDDKPVTVHRKGSFTVKTRISGRHLFKLTVPGYHEVVQEIILEHDKRQPFVVIGTAPKGHALKRREITVSASAEPVHKSATVAETRISRTELRRTASTLGDPIRVLHTLPGVASESDASSRPIVRGGDLLESRVILDGVPLIQPYHYGGARSTFNQSGMDNVTFYKSGFPAQYQNAQSALIVADSRRPANEPPCLDLDISLMQFTGYLGKPLADGKVGFSIAAQSSYYQYVQKAMTWFIGKTAGEEDLLELLDVVSLPDYHDISGGFQFKPTDRLSFYVGEQYNTDGFKFLRNDSMVDVTFHYYTHDSSGTPSFDTMFTERHRADMYGGGPNYLPHEGPPGRWPDSVSASESYRIVDTLMLYYSKSNVLYATGRYTPDAHSVLTGTIAWQRRWWDLNFPDAEAISRIFPEQRFDVSINTFGGYVDWLYSGIRSHLLRTGLQLDYTRSNYDVNLVRYLHEMIISGSTNQDDMWGPVAGDSGMTVHSTDLDDMQRDFSLESLSERLLVHYRGQRRYSGGAIYIQDTWEPTSRLTLDGGLRLEATLADSSINLSPRLAMKYSLTDKHEALISVGHYTQNNYAPPVLALAEELTPEKVWHADIGLESRLLPWLTQKVNIYGKYYYDLITEIIEPSLGRDKALNNLAHHFSEGYLEGLSASSLEELIKEYVITSSAFFTRYDSDGRGLSGGFEYFLRYNAADFWHGWISLSFGRSIRQRERGWRWPPFPFERPLLISFVNYYRLPRRYEFSVKYRFMSGIPYTPIETTDEDATIIGEYNEARYYPYQSLDWRFAKGFEGKRLKGHIYFEIWNSLNIPNIFLSDSETREIKTISFNLPTTVLFAGLDFEL